MREEAQQKLVNDWLKNIKLKPIDQLNQAFESKLKITLSEMIDAGLPAKMLNSIAIEDIKNQLDKGRVTFQELQHAGLIEETIKKLTPPPKNPYTPKTPVEESPLPSPPPPPSPPKNNYIEQIKKDEANAKKVGDWLKEGRVTELQLKNEFGWSDDFIEQIRQFEQVTLDEIPVKELPPLVNNATDIYFLGMPGSGKSTMLASFLAYSNRIGKVKRKTDNLKGAEYYNYLVNSMTKGYLPDSTASDYVNFIPISLRNPHKKGTLHHLNIIDMAGEKFKNVASDGTGKFNKIKDYMKTKNQKCLVFVLDYFPEDERITLIKQDQNLQMVITMLNDELDIMKDVDTIYLIVTKADKFPVDEANKQSFADKYIDDNYSGFLATAQEFKEEHNITLKSFPYSIGETVLTYILKESNPTRNKNLTTYPKMLFDQIIADSFVIRKSIWGKILG